MKKRICLLLVLTLLVCALSACGGEEPEPAGPLYGERGEVERSALGNLIPAADADTVLAALNAAASGQSARWQEGELPRSAGPRVLVLDDAAGDPVVTDGSYVYMFDSYGLVTVTAAGNASKLLAYTKVEREGDHWGERLYLKRDRLAVLWNSADYDSDGAWQNSVQTRIAVFSLEDPAAPKQLSVLSVDGSLVEACLLEDTLCVVTQKTMQTLPQAGEAESVLPKLHENSKTYSLRAGEIYLCPDPAKPALTVAAAIRMKDGRFADALAFTDGTEAVRAEGQHLYLARTRWTEKASAPRQEGTYTVVDWDVAAETEIKRLRLDSGLSLDGGCVLYGALADPGAMELQNAQLRIATQVDERSFSVYTDPEHGWTNREERGRTTDSQLAVLDADLNVLGALARLGGENGIAGCGFLRANAWISSGDTLAAADLSNPAEPRIGESVAVTGETLLLRDLGGSRVLLLSLPGGGEKVKLAVYDLSAPASPKLLDSKELDAAPAGDLTARGALLADAASGYIGWPAAGKNKTEYRLLRWTGSKLEDKGSFSLDYVPENARGLLLDGKLYICSPAQVSVTDPENMKVLATVSNAVG